MKILLTASANRDIAKLGEDSQRRVLTMLREELPTAMATDQTLNLEALDAEVHVHRVGDDGQVALYRTSFDGSETTATILTVIDQNELLSTQRLAEQPLSMESATKDARIGFELLSQIKA